MRPVFDKATCHELALAFAKEHYKPKTVISDDPQENVAVWQDNLANFEGLYINAFQFFSRKRDE